MKLLTSSTGTSNAPNQVFIEIWSASSCTGNRRDRDTQQLQPYLRSFDRKGEITSTDSKGGPFSTTMPYSSCHTLQLCRQPQLKVDAQSCRELVEVVRPPQLPSCSLERRTTPSPKQRQLCSAQTPAARILSGDCDAVNECHQDMRDQVHRTYRLQS